MRIERRDPTLKYPRAVREEKRRLVLDWLLEFQFSSVDLLQVAGRDVAKAQIQTSRLNRYAHIMHDLAVQHAVLKRLDLYDEVIWDKHIMLPDQDEKPDALLHSPKNYWVAFDYEYWRKEDKRIYLSFLNHARALLKRHYSGVYYLFDREEDLVHYQTLFAAPAWPEYHYNRKTGKITPAGTHFQPDAIERLRDCFLFIHEPHTRTRDSP